MKKLIFTAMIGLATVFANAQLKVYSGGKVAVGTTTTVTPTYLLDLANVSGGDVNVGGTTYGYRINGNYVLRNYGNTSDIFVGVNGSIVIRVLLA